MPEPASAGAMLAACALSGQPLARSDGPQGAMYECTEIPPARILPARCPFSGQGGSCPVTTPQPKLPAVNHEPFMKKLKRPQLQHDPKLTRRQLRLLNKSWCMAEVKRHKYCDDGWIVVDGKVFDITEHVATHPGWETGCQVSTVLSIIAHLGTDCTQEFRDIHRSYPQAWKQLNMFYVGDLAC